MEEDKKIIGSEKSQANKETEKFTSLPGLSIQYNDEDKEKKGGELLLPGRIANALSESIIATPRSLEKKYGLTITDEIIRQAVDGSGKIPKLSAMQKGILVALEYQLSLLREEPSVKGYLEKLQNNQNPTENIKEFISLEAICGNIHGQEERWKSGKQARIKEELKTLSETKQLHIYKAEIKDEEGNVKEALVKDFYPYISLTGRERHIQVGKRTAIAVEVEFSRIFLERTWDRYYQLLPSFFDAIGSNDRKIGTDEYKSLHILAMNRAWSHYHYDLPEAEKYIKEQGILDPEKIKQIKEKALTHTPISFDELKAMLEKDVNRREEKRRFKYFLWEAMWALININILTEASSINWDKETFTLVYSETPTIPRSSKPGGSWEKNPFPYKSGKKETE